MIKTLIYSCVFFNEKYIHLINLLLKSYKLFGNSPGDVDYLIICNPYFQKKIQTIFDNLNISGKIWCIDLKTIFEAGYSRLKIFNYPNINLYSKILYLDCDILVTNSINNILDFQLENKLYALQEGNTNHQYWGSQFFDKNTNCSAFTTGILLFNNNTIIKDLFSQILLHINNHITSNSPIPICLDQPFIVYHAIKNNLYNNQKLINIVINNPNNFNNETISHFPGVPGDYESKIVKMTNYMNSVMFNIDKNNNTDIVLFYNKIYKWNNSTITFLKDGNMNAFGAGKYRFIDKYLIKCDFGGREHLLKFNDDYSRFISIRKDDFEVISSDKYKKKLIPKIIMQTAKNKPERYIIDIINQKCPKWTYKHFTDSEIIKYLQENPIEAFPNIIEKFNSFSKGQHKADIFRYYYLYLNGGIFLDSDAIFEVNIDDIIKSYDSVFVKSFMQNTHLFNGFIATYPKNPIIYDALKHAYYTEDIILQKQYHYLCEELWRIYHKHNFTNMKIYQEHNKSREGYGGSVILDDNGDKIISHYWQTKKIPTNTKTYKTDWNNYNTKEINEFDPRVLIGYDCPNPLIRVGPRSDGGYVMVDGFNYDHFLSCGIAGDIRFELALLDKYPNLKCDAFDGTINTFPRHNKNINWEKKNVGYINSEKITDLKPYLKDYKNIFLKMDIEGSEFNWIDSMSLEDLNCFSQIVMEIHWPFDKYRCEMLKKLNQTHYVVHIHGNNYCDRDIPKHLPSGRKYDGTLTINHSNYPSIKLTEVFEITYVRKSNFIDNLTKIEKKYPTSLDSPNNPNTEDIEFTILT